MISAIISRVVILIFGYLYPAYNSYKAIRTKNVKEYVKCMMYWIVFAFFTCIETFTDLFLAWFPFYFEIKVLFVLWLLSPVTKGSSMLYKKFVHPILTRREQEIDEYITQAREKGYTTMLELGSKGINYASTVIMQTAIKGGGNIVSNYLTKSYSLSDLRDPATIKPDQVDGTVALSQQQPKVVVRTKKGSNVTRSSSSQRPTSLIYFPAMEDVKESPRTAQNDYSHVRSVDDISSGYSSSAELSRTNSLNNASRMRIKSKNIDDKMSASYSTLPRTTRRTTEGKVTKTRATK
ncbi:unnamed protein product [Diamesa serratosioi]